MNRGMLTLSAEELQLALSLVPADGQYGLFRQRLEAASTHGTKNVDVECSEEDLEVLLDLLPAPHEQPDSVADQLRTKLQQVLMNMRTPQQQQQSSFLSKLNPLNWFRKTV